MKRNGGVRDELRCCHIFIEYFHSQDSNSWVRYTEYHNLAINDTKTDVIKVSPTITGHSQTSFQAGLKPLSNTVFV
jgi:hypothetical protein